MVSVVLQRGGVRYAAVPGFPGYFVGDDGSVWSQWVPRRRLLGQTWHRLRPGVNSSGYLQVALYRRGQRFYEHVARVVLLAFVGPCPPGTEACHKDNRRTNNRLGNVFWGTKSRNAHDREKHRRERAARRKGAA